MILTLPISHLMTDRNVGEIDCDAYELRRPEFLTPDLLRLIRLSGKPIIWHSSEAVFERNFIRRFGEWANTWGDVASQYSCSFAPNASLFRIMDGKYEALEPCYSHRGLRAAFKRIVNRMREMWPGDISFENTQYYPRPEYDQVSEPETISGMFRANRVGLVLDMAHAQISAKNLGIPFWNYVSLLPLELTTEVHLSRIGRISGEVFDSHYMPSKAEGRMFDRLRTMISEDVYIVVEYYGNFKKIKACYEKLRRLDE